MGKETIMEEIKRWKFDYIRERERELTVAVEPDLHHGCRHKTERRVISEEYRKRQEPSFYSIN